MTDSCTIRVPYMYRDAGNWKAHGTLEFRAPLDDAERTALLDRVRASLANISDGTDFIPEDVDLPELRWQLGAAGDDDHCWHELLLDEVEVLPGLPGEDLEWLHTVAVRFEAASADGWPSQYDPELF